MYVLDEGCTLVPLDQYDGMIFAAAMMQAVTAITVVTRY